MSDVQTVAVAAAMSVCTWTLSRTFLAVRLAAIRASIATTPHEFVMMEKAAKPFKVKAHKTPAPQVYGL